MYVDMHAHTHKCVPKHIYVYAHTCRYTRDSYTHEHNVNMRKTALNTCIHTYMHMNMHIWHTVSESLCAEILTPECKASSVAARCSLRDAACVHAEVHSSMFVCLIHTYALCVVCSSVCMYACMYMCVCVCICVYVNVCICMHVCMYICMYICMYVCMICIYDMLYIYIYIYIYIYTHTQLYSRGRAAKNVNTERKAFYQSVLRLFGAAPVCLWVWSQTYIWLQHTGVLILFQSEWHTCIPCK
jgi:hypothetical protein